MILWAGWILEISEIHLLVYYVIGEADGIFVELLLLLLLLQAAEPEEPGTEKRKRLLDFVRRYLMHASPLLAGAVFCIYFIVLIA
jgi:hypothetical protein